MKNLKFMYMSLSAKYNRYAFEKLLPMSRDTRYTSVAEAMTSRVLVGRASDNF